MLVKTKTVLNIQMPSIDQWSLMIPHIVPRYGIISLNSSYIVYHYILLCYCQGHVLDIVKGMSLILSAYNYTIHYSHLLAPPIPLEYTISIIVYTTLIYLK